MAALPLGVASMHYFSIVARYHSTVSSYASDPSSPQNRLLMMTTTGFGIALAVLYADEFTFSLNRDENVHPAIVAALFIVRVVVALLLPLVGLFYTYGSSPSLAVELSHAGSDPILLAAAQERADGVNEKKHPVPTNKITQFTWTGIGKSCIPIKASSRVHDTAATLFFFVTIGVETGLNCLSQSTIHLLIGNVMTILVLLGFCSIQGSLRILKWCRNETQHFATKSDIIKKANKISFVLEMVAFLAIVVMAACGSMFRNQSVRQGILTITNITSISK